MASQQFQGLRSRAEGALSGSDKALPVFTDPRELVYELQVHQVELEMQNEQLSATQIELDAALERYRDLFAFAPVGYVVQGPHGIDEANRTFAELLDTAPGTLAGVQLADFVVPKDLNAFRRHERGVLESDTRKSVELQLITRHGEVRTVRLQSVRTSAATQRWRTAVSDVTEERRLAHQLVVSARQDESGPVARGLAHDFGHVLMSMMAQADRALARLSPDHPSRAPLDELKRAATDAAIMVTGLLDQARHAGTTPASSDIDREIRSLEPVLRGLCAPTVEVVFALNADGACVPITPAELTQILVNLVANAHDATSTGEIRVETGPGSRADTVVLHVADTGRGMDVDAQARAFEPFFTTKASAGGTGLGLSTVYGVVKRAGGELRLRSEPVKGTSVSLVLPCVEPQVARAAVQKRSQALSVLVVEDDKLVRRAARRALESGGYDVLEAGSAAEALEILRSAPAVHLLLSDVGLPGVDGPALVRAARAVLPGLRALMMSGLEAQDLDVPEATRFVPKPFSTATLLQHVHSALVETGGELPTVLVVEDDGVSLMAYQELLWNEGFRMLAAKTVSEALELFQRNAARISAVLTDFNLPDGSGARLATDLHGVRPDLPVVFVSGQSAGDPEIRAACLEPHTEFAAKPVEIAEVAKMLRRLLVTG